MCGCGQCAAGTNAARPQTSPLPSLSCSLPLTDRRCGSCHLNGFACAPAPLSREHHCNTSPLNATVPRTALAHPSPSSTNSPMLRLNVLSLPTSSYTTSTLAPASNAVPSFKRAFLDADGAGSSADCPAAPGDADGERALLLFFVALPFGGIGSAVGYGKDEGWQVEERMRVGSGGFGASRVVKGGKSTQSTQLQCPGTLISRPAISHLNADRACLHWGSRDAATHHSRISRPPL
jgi:hypothetical protein